MLILAALTLGTATVLPPNWFPFVIPWDDAVPGTATDVSFLNTMPAGKFGRIVSKGGHFVEERSGKRVRFLGANMAGAAAFPEKADADKVAARLAKLGFNIVRLHHLQNNWELNIWKKGRSMIEIDPVMVDRLDFFIAALKRHGIYTNLNLQTTRSYLPEMGFPKSVLDIPFGFDKRIDKVDQHMIALQKQYAKEMLDRINPYTGLKYKDEPALAVVEINNENSLVGDPGEQPGSGLNTLPEPFLQEIVDRWNDWLLKKYGSDSALRDGWTKGATPNGPSLLNNTTRWSFENQSNGDVQFQPSGRFGLVAAIQSNTGPDWHVQAHYTGLTLREGDTYTVQFRARASAPGQISIASNLDQDDWHNLGLSAGVTLTTEWKTYRYSFVAHGVVPAHARIGFAMGGARGRIEIDDLDFHPGAGNPIAAGTSLAAHSIALPSGGTLNQMSDYVQFLAETERAYSDSMRSYLRKDLGIQANLIDTQISWGGLTGMVRERDSDFADNHAYWEHPNFPRKAWDANDWTVRNTAMVNELPKRGGELAGLAHYRVAGKPYTISEYNHPAPSDYRVEMMPLLSTVGAAQDWDILYVFDYGNTGTGLVNDRIQGFFAVATDPVKAAFFPSAALMFRSGLVNSLLNTYELTLPEKYPWRPNFFARDAWINMGTDPLKYRMSVRLGEATLPSSVFRVIESSPLACRKGEKGTIYTTDTPRAKAIVGFVGGEVVELAGATFSFGAMEHPFAAATLVPTDGKPVAQSERLLLTLGGRAENEGMSWNSTRTSVGSGWGTGPVQVEGVSVKVSLTTPLRQVWALDPNGRRRVKLPSKVKDGKLLFEITPEAKSMWFELSK